jgi:hypothetical protein
MTAEIIDLTHHRKAKIIKEAKAALARGLRLPETEIMASWFSSGYLSLFVADAPGAAVFSQVGDPNVWAVQPPCDTEPVV